MKDSLHAATPTRRGSTRSYQAHYAAYIRIFERLRPATIAVGADVGMMGGSLAHEFMVLTPHGEDTLVLCDACGYAANQQIATVRKPEPPRRGAAADRGSRHAGHRHHRRAGRVPRVGDRPHRQGDVLRRPATGG